MYDIIKNFKIIGNVMEVQTYGNGHINSTYIVKTDKEKYILQEINTSVFRNYEELTENILSVTNFLKAKIKKNGGDVNRETLTLVHANDGKYFYKSKDGKVWRMYFFINDAYCMDNAEDKESFYQSALAFGNFQMLLSDFPAETLHETIKNFHNTPKRMKDFEEALKADKLSRAEEVKQEIDFLLKRKGHCSYLTDKLSNGTLTLKVTHNDTKLNNILIDKKSNKGICIIDLDTVMPGLVAYDFGDSIRSGANHCTEDEHDLSKVDFDKDLYDIYLDGFLKGTSGLLTDEEISSLPYGAYLMTLECGIRFLTDYLNGDVYFKTSYPKQNLYRARTQFKLASQICDKLNLF